MLVCEYVRERERETGRGGGGFEERGGRTRSDQKTQNRFFFPSLIGSVFFFVFLFTLLPTSFLVQRAMDPNARLAVLARQLGAGARQGERG